MDKNFSSNDIEYKNYAVEPKDSTVTLWRYLSIKKYLDLLVSNSLYFCRIDKFQDQYEGTPNSYTSELIENSFEEFPNAEEMRGQWKVILRHLRKISFVNCWHMADEESPEMWSQYCPNGKGVLIKSSFERIQGSLIDMNVGHLFISPVTYAKSIEEPYALLNGMKLLCYKRPEFKYENEYRLILQYMDGEPSNEDGANSYTVLPPENGFKHKVNLDALIDEVYLSTNLSYLDRLRLNLLTKIALKKSVRKSRIN